MVRFRKGQKVRVPYQGRHYRGEIIKHAGDITLIEIKDKEFLRMLPNGRRWWCSDGVTRIYAPRTRIDKLIDAYCEVEFKQMGIER